MMEINEFHSKGVNKRGFSSLDAIMGTLLTGAGVSGYNFIENLNSRTGEYDIPTIVGLGFTLGIVAAGYITIRYIGATDTPSNINDNDSNSRFMAQTSMSEYNYPPY